MALAFFETPRFPEPLSYGSSGGPQYSTGIAALQSGFEQRVAIWSYPLHAYDASMAIRTRDDVQAIRRFFHLARGRLRGFRFKDWDDYSSTADDRSAPQASDQVLGVGDGVLKVYALAKTYQLEGETQARRITKPVAGSVLVAKDGIPQASGWSVDTATGLVTFTTAPGSGVVVSAGYEFDVPVRFDLDRLRVAADAYGIRSTEIPILELRRL